MTPREMSYHISVKEIPGVLPCMDVEPTVDETDDVNGLHVSFKEYASNDNVLTEEHIRDIRNAIMSKMNQLEQVKLERFNGKKLKEYEATDTPYQLINKRNNRKCYLIGYDAGVDHDQVCIQEDYYDARKRKQYQFYTVKDMSDFLIWTGGVNVEPGDVIRYSFGKEPGSRESSFYYTYEGISQLDMRGARGMCLYNGMSSTGERFDRFGTWHEIDDEHPIYIAKATKEEYMQYVELMRKNGYRLFEDGRIVARAEERERCIEKAQYLYCKMNCPSFVFCIKTVGRRRFLLAECEGREDIRKAIEGGEQ